MAWNLSCEDLGVPFELDFGLGYRSSIYLILALWYHRRNPQDSMLPEGAIVQNILELAVSLGLGLGAAHGGLRVGCEDDFDEYEALKLLCEGVIQLLAA